MNRRGFLSRALGGLAAAVGIKAAPPPPVSYLAYMVTAPNIPTYVPQVWYSELSDPERWDEPASTSAANAILLLRERYPRGPVDMGLINDRRPFWER